jgi:hypothetical protein
MLRSTALATIACTFLSAACAVDAGSSHDLGGVAELEEGAAALTAQGAFLVEVWSEEGALAEGENTVWVRVAMPDPTDPLAEGHGIPGARIHVELASLGGDEPISALRATEHTAGLYGIEGVVLSAGEWQLDLDIAVGETVRDDVTFFFAI